MLESGNPAIFASGVSVAQPPPTGTPGVCAVLGLGGSGTQLLRKAGFREG